MFVRDIVAHRTERISVDSNGGLMDAGWDAGIDASGRHAAFTALVCPHTPADDEAPDAIGVHDQLTGATWYAGLRNYAGKQNPCVPTQPASAAAYGSNLETLSADGRRVAFSSNAANLVPADTNGVWDVFVQDTGPDLGVGELVSSGKLTVSGASRFAATGVLSAVDPSDDVGPATTTAGAKLTRATLAYRPAYGDLYARLELRHMPIFALANPALVYGLDLTVGGTKYEVRVAKTGADASFWLFRLAAGDWTRVASLQGGYGTTGQEVVFSLPLRKIGAQRGGRISGVTAFTALGSSYTGVVHPIDRIALSR